MNLKLHGEISISQVIADIRANPGKPFHLIFLRASGRDKGEFKTVAKCLYGRSMQLGTKPNPNAERASPMHTDHGTLPVSDYDTGEYLTPLISHIISFNLLKVKH